MVDTPGMLRRALVITMTVAAGLIAFVAVVRPEPVGPIPARPAAVTGTSTTTAPDDGRRHVVAFGDSLLHESRDQLAVLVAGRASLETHTRPMTAPCDWRAEAALVAATRPDIVVIEFSGNALTPCMRRPDGSALTAAARADHYRLDLTAMVDAFTAAGASVLLVDAPRGRPGASRGDQFDGPEPFTVPILHSIERRATRTGAPVVVVPAARSVLTRAGDWTATLPCRAVDRAQGGCTGGRATVRAPDGAHFCPAEWPDERGICPVWSPGAWRYAAAIAAAI